jgi:uncharacterized membrane-anchored protein YhcB (DUF1043 family)
MRGRELPGFVSARLLMGSVASDLEASRQEVEQSFAQCVECFATTASLLASKLSGKVSEQALKCTG